MSIKSHADACSAHSAGLVCARWWQPPRLETRRRVISAWAIAATMSGGVAERILKWVAQGERDPERLLEAALMEVAAEPTSA